MGVIDKVGKARAATAQADAALPLDSIVMGDCIAAMQSPMRMVSSGSAAGSVGVAVARGLSFSITPTQRPPCLHSPDWGRLRQADIG